MSETNISWRPMRLVTGLFGVLLAFSVACNGGPTEPSNDDLVRMYTGRWRGNINGFEVVLDVQATKDSPGGGIALDGRGTARSATGEIDRLRINGGALVGAGFDLMVERPGGTAPAGVILASTGYFHGELSRDGRTWPGRFTSWAATLAGAAAIFGPGEHSVTLLKE